MNSLAFMPEFLIHGCVRVFKMPEHMVQYDFVTKMKKPKSKSKRARKKYRKSFERKPSLKILKMNGNFYAPPIVFNSLKTLLNDQNRQNAPK